MFKSLKGKRTYLICAVGAIVFFIARLGYIGVDLEAQLYTILGIGGVAALRAGVAK